jgi:hypothetical protein
MFYTFEDFVNLLIHTPLACYLYHLKETLPINELKRITTFGGCADQQVYEIFIGVKLNNVDFSELNNAVDSISFMDFKKSKRSFGAILYSI